MTVSTNSLTSSQIQHPAGHPREKGRPRFVRLMPFQLDLTSPSTIAAESSFEPRSRAPGACVVSC